MKKGYRLLQMQLSFQYPLCYGEMTAPKDFIKKDFLNHNHSNYLDCHSQNTSLVIWNCTWNTEEECRHFHKGKMEKKIKSEYFCGMNVSFLLMNVLRNDKTISTLVGGTHSNFISPEPQSQICKRGGVIKYYWHMATDKVALWASTWREEI